MQGVLIASADTAVRKSLAAILQEGRTVHECGSASDCLALAAAQRMDYVFVDDVFDDGRAEELARRLHSLGYGIEILPILLSPDPLYLQPFQPYGVRHFVSKPFDVPQIEAVIGQIEQVVSLRELPPVPAGEKGYVIAEHGGSGDSDSLPEIDVREISQRFRRLLAQSLSREELVHAFVENMQEQFDVDNVVVLLPGRGEPLFRVFTGNISEEIRQQFFLPFDEPLIATLIRLAEPVWVHDVERLGRANTVTALRCGERLGIQLVCPVLSRGRVLAIVGLSRLHRYGSSPVLASLLRLFFTFFSKALENAELFEKAAQARETYQNMVEALPWGTLAIAPSGRIRYVSPSAATCLNMAGEDLLEQPAERAGSLLADLAREVLATGHAADPRPVSVARPPLLVSALPIPLEGQTGVLLVLQAAEAGKASEPVPGQEAEQELLWRNMAGVVAHNFKNALVPIKTCAELLPGRFDNESFRKSFFEIVTDSISRIDNWIERLLRFSDVKDERQNWATLLLQECLEQAATDVLKLPLAAGVDVVREFSAAAVVKGHPQYLRLVMAELLRNAVDAVQGVSKPKIWLRTATDGAGGAVAEVEDNGPGLDEAAKAALFQPFTTRKLSGLGIGLAFARRAVLLHGGDIRIKSGSTGGTLAQMVLPLGAPVQPDE